jgi:Na+/proline symporter
MKIFLVGTGAICALYTVIGGMKATVWIDTFQVAIMFIGLITVIIMGSADIKGGFNEVWDRAYRSGRIEFFE